MANGHKRMFLGIILLFVAITLASFSYHEYTKPIYAQVAGGRIWYQSAPETVKMIEGFKDNPEIASHFATIKADADRTIRNARILGIGGLFFAIIGILIIIRTRKCEPAIHML